VRTWGTIALLEKGKRPYNLIPLIVKKPKGKENIKSTCINNLGSQFGHSFVLSPTQ
jgi:hypothetical protein